MEPPAYGNPEHCCHNKKVTCHVLTKDRTCKTCWACSHYPKRTK